MKLASEISEMKLRVKKIVLPILIIYVLLLCQESETDNANYAVVDVKM